MVKNCIISERHFSNNIVKAYVVKHHYTKSGENWQMFHYIFVVTVTSHFLQYSNH